METVSIITLKLPYETALSRIRLCMPHLQIGENAFQNAISSPLQSRFSKWSKSGPYAISRKDHEKRHNHVYFLLLRRDKLQSSVVFLTLKIVISSSLLTMLGFVLIPHTEHHDAGNVSRFWWQCALACSTVYGFVLTLYGVSLMNFFVLRGEGLKVGQRAFLEMWFVFVLVFPLAKFVVRV